MPMQLQRKHFPRRMHMRSPYDTQQANPWVAVAVELLRNLAEALPPWLRLAEYLRDLVLLILDRKHPLSFHPKERLQSSANRGNFLELFRASYC